MSTVRRTRTELKRTTSVQLSRGSREAEIGARPGLEGEVADLEVELEAVEERVSRLMNLIEEKMPLYKQVVGIFYGDGLLFLACLVAITVAPSPPPHTPTIPNCKIPSVCQASKALGSPKPESLSLDPKRSLVFHGVELDQVSRRNGRQV